MKIPYLLAKQLKDAGFPQNLGEAYYLHLAPKRYFDSKLERFIDRPAIKKFLYSKDPTKGFRNNEVTAAPSLSELIIAIERLTFSYWGLEKHSNDYRAGLLKTGGIDEGIMRSGSTPEEALANLWIQLNSTNK